MKYLVWLILIAAALVLGVFAIHNHHSVALDLWPLPFGEVRIAAFVLVLLAVFAGFLLGGLCAWIGGARARRASRAKSRALALVRRELAEKQARVPTPAAIPAPPARA